MEQFDLRIPWDFIASRVDLSWNDALFGFENQLLLPAAVVEIATAKLSSNQANADLIELATSSADAPVYGYIEALAGEEGAPSPDHIARKWLYLSLAWIFENRSGLDDPLEIVERVYADFDYPQSIESFVRYMPGSDANPDWTGSPEDRLFRNWRDFLEAELAVFGNDK
ncbi:MAG: DUF2247 family protein [bacterium]|nr:DUF2247 family protein [bacterium]